MKIEHKNIYLSLIVYLFFTIVFILKMPAIYSNIINPIFWGILILLSIINMRKCHVLVRKDKKLTMYMIVISSIHIIAYFYAGFIFGFSKSPYNHSLFMILKNALIQIIPIIGIEILRYILVLKNKNNRKAIILITVLFILLEINYNTIFALICNRRELFIYICSSIIPLISYSMLFTYLTTINSFILPIIFRTFSRLVAILLTILPNINWFVQGTTCALSAVLTYILFKYKFVNDNKFSNNNKFSKQNKTPKSYIVTIIALLALILFMLGFFKYKPIAIMSNSMYPTYSRGDVVIYKKVSEDEIQNIKVGTILIYSIETQNIAHRVTKIIKDNETLLFQTKGDSNNIADTRFVAQNQIEGVYVFHIKYLGVPAVLFNEFLNASYGEF